MDDIAILQGFKVFAGLSRRELEQIAKIAVPEEHEAGYEVIEERDVASALYLVQSGMVAVKMSSRGGQEVLIDELGPGELFGWSAVLDDQTFTAAVSTIDKSTLLAFDGERLREVFQKQPGIGFQVVSNIAAVISSRLEHLRSKLADEPFAPEWLSSPAQAGTVGAPSMGSKSEMRNMACPSCGTANHPFAVVNETEQYRCRNCGMVYYSPAGCE
jgi:CRP/FNR family transcriptional regulator, cyclic AMP receptor protein